MISDSDPASVTDPSNIDKLENSDSGPASENLISQKVILTSETVILYQ